MRVDPKLEGEVAALSGLSREELVAAWLKAHGHAPPSGIRNEMLLRSAAWHLQAKRLGGFSGETRRQLKHAMRVADVEIAARQEAKGRASAASQRDSIGVATPDVAASSHNDGNQPIDLAATHDGRGTGIAGAQGVSRAIVALPQPPQPSRSSPGVGARLLREWNGRTHVVDVVEGGFVYAGRQHRSLSAVAKLITGAHWSGPRFFGL